MGTIQARGRFLMNRKGLVRLYEQIWPLAGSEATIPIPSSIAAARAAVAEALHWPNNLGVQLRTLRPGSGGTVELLAVFIQGLADEELIRLRILEPLERFSLRGLERKSLTPAELQAALTAPRIHALTRLVIGGRFFERIEALGLLLLAMTLLSGCWDRMEVEDMVYLIAIGIDKAEDALLMLTALVAVTSELTAGGAQPPVRPERSRLAAQVLTARAETITQALYVLNGGLTRRLDLRQVRAAIVGEELSREGLEPLVMELTRSPWARGNIFFAQARGRAFDVLTGINPVSEVNPPKMVEGLIIQAKSLHLAPPTRLHHFVARHVAEGGDPYLPAMAVNPAVSASPQEPRVTEESALPGELPRSGGNPVEYAGTATFRDGKPHVKVRLLFEGEVLAAPGGTDYVSPQQRTRLEEAAGQYARETIRGLLERLREWEADPVGFGHLYRGRFVNWQAWEAFAWRRQLGELTVEVEPEMRIRRHGLVVGPDRVQGGR
ncbi:MAG: Ger(x)C family spore germination protein [Bacillota bacterium]